VSIYDLNIEINCGKVNLFKSLYLMVFASVYDKLETREIILKTPK
jgi:hypothetical protein